MNHTGLYSPFKINRPLSGEEIKNQLRQDYTGMGKVDSLALDDTVVIRMNSTYLELVDKYYSDRGMPESLVFIMLSAVVTFFISMVYLLFFNPTGTPNTLSGVFCILLACVISLSMAIWIYTYLRKSWFTWTHYPVRFNRKTKMVHVFKVDGTILSVPWKEVFFTRGRAGPGAMPEWSIDGHILAEDGKTVIDTFSLGFSNARQELITNWAFVRSYMEVDDCLSDLKDIIVLCPPVAERRESFIFGLQYMMRVESRLEWPFTLILLPLKLLGGVARFVAMRTSKIPRWSAAVEADCRVDPADPINVSAANNPKHIWRYVLANQSLEEYQALYQRQTAAMERLREKVRKSAQAGRVQQEG